MYLSFEDSKPKREKYWELAQECKTDNQKIAFFDEYEEAFSLDPDPGEELNNADMYYREEECDPMNDEEFDQWQDMKWKDYPEKYKLYLFDYVILKGMAYEDFQP